MSIANKNSAVYDNKLKEQLAAIKDSLEPSREMEGAHYEEARGLIEKMATEYPDAKALNECNEKLTKLEKKTNNLKNQAQTGIKEIASTLQIGLTDIAKEIEDAQIGQGLRKYAQGMQEGLENISSNLQQDKYSDKQIIQKLEKAGQKFIKLFEKTGPNHLDDEAIKEAISKPLTKLSDIGERIGDLISKAGFENAGKAAGQLNNKICTKADNIIKSLDKGLKKAMEDDIAVEFITNLVNEVRDLPHQAQELKLDTQELGQGIGKITKGAVKWLCSHGNDPQRKAAKQELAVGVKLVTGEGKKKFEARVQDRKNKKEGRGGR